jgi:FHA domain-containing protein
VIIIEAVTLHGQPLAQTLAAEFDELGGNIGRAEGNTLTLTDSEKIISRVHAAIVFREGRYLICDSGSVTPVYINGRALGKGRESPIEAGDELRIGGYTLTVKPGTTGAVGASAAARAAAAAPPSASAGNLGQVFEGEVSDGHGGVFDGLIPAPEARSTLAAASPTGEPFAGKPTFDAKPGADMGIPPDFDPFEAPPAPPTAQRSAQPIIPDDFNLGPGIGSAQSVDKLFDLKPSAQTDPFAPGHPLAPFHAQSQGQGAAPLQRDDVPEVRGSFPLPRVKPDSGPQASAPAAHDESKDMIVSWDQAGGQSGEIKTVIISPPPAPQRLGAEPAGDTDSFGNKWQQTQGTAAGSAAPAVASTSARRDHAPPAEPSDGELLRAFLAGAGVPDLPMTALSPQLMQIFGRLLREATQGTLDLLAARAIAKREMRAEMTMIIPSENNPLKFSPNVEAALSHLLLPQGHGFMTPLRAMRDAYDDLRAHQFASMAGMRDALAGVLARFDPAALERRLTQKSVIDSVIPMNRKAKLWDLFEQLYSDILREAEDHFHALFGREFVRAYEAQLAKLDQGNRGRSE